MADNKIFGMLGLCKRAGRLVLGFDITKEAIQKGNAFLVLVAKDTSPKTVKEINLEAEKAKIKLETLPFTMDEIGNIVAKRTGVLAVCDKGFAERISLLIEESAKGTL